MASARVPRDMEKGESLEVTHPEFELLADPPGCLPTAADRTGSAPARSWGGATTPSPRCRLEVWLRNRWGPRPSRRRCRPPRL